MTDIVLIFPPQWHPAQPHLALFQLSGYLRKKEHSVCVADLNNEYYRSVLTENAIKAAGHKIVARIDHLEEKHILNSSEQQELKDMLKLFRFIIPVSRSIENAVSILQDKQQALESEKYIWALDIINSALKIISLPFYPECMSLQYYHSSCNTDDSSEFIDHIKNDKNMFTDMFQQWINDNEILLKNASVIGINITDYGQLVPGFSVAHYIKQKYGSFIVFGGSYITKLRPCMNDLWRLFDIADMFCFYQGEHALADIYEYVKDRRTIDHIRNVCYMKNNTVIHNSVALFDEYVTADLSDIKNYTYFSSELVIPIQYRRGCAYGKCTFCEHALISSSEQQRTSKHIEQFIEDILYYQNTFHTPYFYIIDDMIPVNEIVEISNRLISVDANIKWMCYALFQNGFCNDDNMDLFVRAGLEKIWFGFESACDRVLDLMNKTRASDLVTTVLQKCHKFDIAVHLFCIIGFPGETSEEAMQTIQFLIDHENILDTRYFSLDLFTYSFMRNSVVFQKRMQYNIKPEHIHDMQIYFRKYTVEKGIDAAEAQDIVMQAADKIKKVYMKSLFLKYTESQDSTHLVYKSNKQ